MPLNLVDSVLRVVDGRTLSREYRDLLEPGDWLHGHDGASHRLPRFFYEVDSWPLALSTPLTPHFGLWEFLDVDVREAGPLRQFPRYVPCAVVLLAAVLEMFRLEAGAPVRISANGGYRSPSHARTRGASPHAWGTAADVYCVGSDLLDSPDRIERYAAAARRGLPFATVRPYGSEAAATDDHLHIDIGYVTVVPPGTSERDDESSDGSAR
jgi:hypothetical protein